MIRFIMRTEAMDSCNGLKTNQLWTIECECPELEAALSRGGSGETGYEYVSLVGAEVRTSNAPSERAR